MTKLPVWDLSAYYSGIDDPKIQSDITESLKKAEDFEKKYRGKITNDTAADFVLKAIQEYESILLQAYKPVVYAQNSYSIESQNPKFGILFQKTMKAVTELSSVLTFFTLSLNDLSLDKIKALAQSKELGSYKHFFEKIVEAKPHRLSEKEEIILQQKALTSGHAFVRLYDDHKAEKKYSIALKGEIKQVTESEILDLMRDPDREKRKAASEALTKGLGEQLKITTYIYNTLGEDKNINDRLTKFSSPEQSRHMDNDIDPGVVDLMASVVAENYSIVHDYYRAKKNWLGFDELYEYDRYAPFFESKIKYEYDEAKQIVLNAFTKFSPEFSGEAERFFKNNWIHAPVLPGKRGGAYCSGGTPDKHPLILLNYQGRLDDVNTMAHELGHGVNDLMMMHLSPLNYDVTLVLAETASVFAEMLVFDDLKQKITDPSEKFGLYAAKIESIFATVFRQISMYKFEQAFHHARKSEGELTSDQINQFWNESQVQMFGDSVKFNKGTETWWSYIPHFIHTPFYVYAYAFGELLVLALYAKYKQEGSSFIPKYMDLMRAGVTASPQELLKPLGIDLNDKKFWQNGINIIKEMVEETKNLRK